MRGFQGQVMQRPCFKVQSRVSKPPLTASINGSGARRSGLRNASCGRIGTVRDDLEPQHPASIDTTSDATAHVKSGEAPSRHRIAPDMTLARIHPSCAWKHRLRCSGYYNSVSRAQPESHRKSQNQYGKAMRHPRAEINRQARLAGRRVTTPPQSRCPDGIERGPATSGAKCV